MSTLDALAALRPVLAVFKRLGVPYYLGGSIVSSAYGLPRATLDVDLVADLRPEHVPSLIEALHADYYLSPEAIRSAIARKSCFNLIHLATMFKVDVFAVKDRSYDRIQWERIRKGVVDLEDPESEFPLASPEDIVLNKLEWYRLGGEVSERQWGDVLGVLKVQGDAMDRDYMDRWARQLGVADLLERAWNEACGGRL